MRSRRLLSLSIAAAAALVLTGCAGGASETTPTNGETTAAAEETPTGLCDNVAETGDAVKAVTVEGAFDAKPTTTFTTPLTIENVERAVVIEGDGEAAKEGDLVTLKLAVYDATTGEELTTQGYDEDPLVPSQLVAGSVLGDVIGCEPVGTRVAFTLPANENSPTALVYIADFTAITPKVAWGEDQPAVDGMPTVELAEDGRPTITIPEGDAPTEVKLATLKEGDGAVVASGDEVLVNYAGVKWSDGSEFDASWNGGAPISFPTTGVVEGFKQALEGHKVGSQVLVVVPPAFGYGPSEGHELQKETLVFVVDILAKQTPTAAQ